jgi:hypothetical protein
MTTVNIVTSDNKIWNTEQVYTKLSQAVTLGHPFQIDLLNEAPDLRSIGLYDYLEQYGIDLKHITIHTANALEKHNQIHIEYHPPLHLVENAKVYITDIFKNSQLKHFGLFVGRSNGPRLHLATYLNQHHCDKLILSYHYNSVDEFHRDNIGLEDLITNYNVNDVSQEAEFISQCPIQLKDDTIVHNDKTLKLNYAQQLFDNDQDYFSRTYNNFFVELVCESFFTGNTFFPTEKTFRPMLLKTPFIVQGPQYFLHNLKKLGFQTFDQWWDEGYSEDPTGHQLAEIKKVLDFLSTKSIEQLNQMYLSMLDILEHNYQLAITLNKEDFKKLYE